MLEAAKSQRLKVRVLFVLLAMVVAIMAASVLSNSPSPLGTKEADAATPYRAVKGTVFWSNTQQAVPYARVNLYRWQYGRWNLYKQQYANSSGQYYLSNIPTGYYYYVNAVKPVNGINYWGNGKSFYLRPDYSIPANSTVYVYWGA